MSEQSIHWTPPDYEPQVDDDGNVVTPIGMAAIVMLRRTGKVGPSGFHFTFRGATTGPSTRIEWHGAVALVPLEITDSLIANRYARLATADDVPTAEKNTSIEPASGAGSESEPPQDSQPGEGMGTPVTDASVTTAVAAVKPAKKRK